MHRICIYRDCIFFKWSRRPLYSSWIPWSSSCASSSLSSKQHKVWFFFLPSLIHFLFILNISSNLNIEHNRKCMNCFSAVTKKGDILKEEFTFLLEFEFLWSSNWTIAEIFLWILPIWTISHCRNRFLRQREAFLSLPAWSELLLASQKGAIRLHNCGWRHRWVPLGGHSLPELQRAGARAGWLAVR